MLFVYSGGYAPYDGVEGMAEGFIQANLSAKLLLSGRPSSSILEIIRNNDNILLPGFLSRADLHRVMLDADCFVCPRSALDPNRITTFPSKLLLYMAYKKPILCQVCDEIPLDLLSQYISVRTGAAKDWADAFNYVIQANSINSFSREIDYSHKSYFSVANFLGFVIR